MPPVLYAMINLAATYYQLHQYTEAEKLQREVLKWLNQILGEQHPHNKMAIAHLVATYYKLGHHAEAIEMEKVL